MKFIKNKYDIIFSLLIILLPFSKGISNVIIGILAIIFLIDFKKEYFSKYINSPYLFLSITVFYLYLQAILNESFILDIDFYKTYAYLIIIPILFKKVEQISVLKVASLLTINATIFISIFNIIQFYRAFNFLPFADTWATNYVLVLERPYAGIFSVISVIISFDLYTSFKTKFRYIFLLSLIISILFIAFISIRISIVTLLILFIVYVLLYLKSTRMQKVFFLSGVLIFFSLILIFNGNVAKRFFIKDSLHHTVEKTKQFEPRVVIWDCAYQITKQENFSMLFGTNSYSNVKNSLVGCYSESVEDYSRRSWFLERKFNTHSQFIDLYIIGGLGAIFLISIFFFKAMLAYQYNFFSISIFISFIMMMCVENIFHRQFGCLIFTIFTALYTTSKTKQCQD